MLLSVFVSMYYLTVITSRSCTMNTLCTLHEFCMNTNGKMTSFVYYEYYDLDTRVFFRFLYSLYYIDSFFLAHRTLVQTFRAKKKCRLTLHKTTLYIFYSPLKTFASKFTYFVTLTFLPCPLFLKRRLYFASLLFGTLIFAFA